MYKKMHHLTIGIDLKSRLGSRSNKTYPLHNITYAPAKFEGATSNGSERTRNVTGGRIDAHTYGQTVGGTGARTTDQLWHINMPFILQKKTGITIGDNVPNLNSKMNLLYETTRSCVSYVQCALT